MHLTRRDVIALVEFIAAQHWHILNGKMCSRTCESSEIPRKPLNSHEFSDELRKWRWLASSRFFLPKDDPARVIMENLPESGDVT